MVFTNSIKNDFKILGYFYACIFALYMFNIVVNRSFGKRGAAVKNQCTQCGDKRNISLATTNTGIELNKRLDEEKEQIPEPPIEIPKKADPKPKRPTESMKSITNTVMPSESRCDNLGPYPSVFEATQSTWSAKTGNIVVNQPPANGIVEYDINNTVTGCLMKVAQKSILNKAVVEETDEVVVEETDEVVVEETDEVLDM